MISNKDKNQTKINLTDEQINKLEDEKATKHFKEKEKETVDDTNVAHKNKNEFVDENGEVHINNNEEKKEAMETKKQEVITKPKEEKEIITKKINNITLEDGTFNFGGYADIVKFAYKIADTDLIPKDYRGKPDSIAICIAQGQELGLSPFFSLKNIAVINGRATLWGDALMSLVQTSGLMDWQDLKYEGTWKQDDWKCIFSVKRLGRGKPVVREFSWAQAKEAGLTSRNNVWKSYPQRMLMQRARSYALRDCFPDILGGLYSKEEMVDSNMKSIKEPKEKKIVDVTDYTKKNNEGL